MPCTGLKLEKKEISVWITKQVGYTVGADKAVLQKLARSRCCFKHKFASSNTGEHNIETIDN